MSTPKPQPPGDPGHILPENVWAAVVADRDRIVAEIDAEEATATGQDIDEGGA